jgi:DNA-binding transcriptional MerR regulator
MFSIKDISKRVDLPAHTLRYYENEGLLPNIKRDDNGNRIYDNHDIEWLNFVKCLRGTGMPIKEMKNFVSLMIQGENTIPERIEILYTHKKVMEDKIIELKNFLNNIDCKIKFYESKIK